VTTLGKVGPDGIKMVEAARIGVCRLCSASAELQYSHVFPRFAVKYLKDSSATPFLRNVVSGKRMQEAQRFHLLCESCEQLLGKDEKAFCEKFFRPLHKHNEGSFQYDKWLLRFLVGLHWKILVTKRDIYPDYAEAAYTAVEPEWKAFLLGQRLEPGSTEFHLFIGDVIQDATHQVSPKLNSYLARALDATPTFSKSGQVGCYVKVLRVMSYAFITPREPEDENWIGTQVFEQGTLSGPQTIDSRGFGPLIEDRVKVLEVASSKMTADQLERFKENAMRNPERFLNSETTRVALANRELQARMAVRLRARGSVAKGRDRNKPCGCGSGLKVKKCCGYTHG
jgi:hypothetical protein